MTNMTVVIWWVFEGGFVSFYICLGFCCAVMMMSSSWCMTNVRLGLVSWQTLTMCNNTTGLENQTRPEMNPQCFLRSSPENRVSPRASPNHHISNGPFNKVTALNYNYLLDAFWDHLLFHLNNFPNFTCSVWFLILPVFSPSLSSSSSLHLPSLPSSFSPPPLLLSFPRQESLPAMRRPSNRAATCTSTMFHRLDTHTTMHHSNHAVHFSSSSQLLYFQFSPALRNCLVFGESASSLLTSLTVFSGSHSNQPANGRLVRHSHREWR